MVLVPGAAVLGRDEPRLKALARTFARAGFAVLVPELPEVRRLRAVARRCRPRGIGAALPCGGREPGVPLGVAAVSYAVAPAIIAVLQGTSHRASASSSASAATATPNPSSASSPPARFARAATAASTGANPTATARWAFLVANAGRLDNPGDAYLLEEIGRLRFHDRDADISRQAAALGAQGRAVLALVENRDPDAVTRLIAALPERVRSEIDGLNLALYDLSQARGHLILVHGRSDPMVPYSESQDLAVAASGARVSLFLIDDIGHVEFTAVNIRNAWTMWQAIVALLGERS